MKIEKGFTFLKPRLLLHLHFKSFASKYKFNQVIMHCCADELEAVCCLHFFQQQLPDLKKKNAYSYFKLEIFQDGSSVSSMGCTADRQASDPTTSCGSCQTLESFKFSLHSALPLLHSTVNLPCNRQSWKTRQRRRAAWLPHASAFSGPSVGYSVSRKGNFRVMQRNSVDHISLVFIHCKSPHPCNKVRNYEYVRKKSRFRTPAPSSEEKGNITAFWSQALFTHVQTD
jgi:hypothetical protein